MYSNHLMPPRRDKETWARRLIPNLSHAKAIDIYDKRVRYLEILDVCLDLVAYLVVLKLKSTSRIDKMHLLGSSDSLLGYGRESMQEMLVIRLKDIFHTQKGNVESFKFHDFHQSLKDAGIAYPKPSLETNDAIARIINRRDFYSAHRSSDKKNAKAKNRIKSLDLIATLSYVGYVEEVLFGGPWYDPFERLMNDEVEVDHPLFFDHVYEALTGKLAYDDELGDVDSKEFLKYKDSSRREIVRLMERVIKEY